jgi:hypothetical protein
VLVVVVGAAVVELVVDVVVVGSLVVVVVDDVVVVVLDVVPMVGSVVVVDDVVVVVDDVVVVVDDVVVVVVLVVVLVLLVVVVLVLVGDDVVVLDEVLLVVVEPPIVDVVLVDAPIVLLVDDVEVVVVGCGGQASKRGPHTSTYRSRSARPAAAVTWSTSLPGRGRMTGPRCGTTSGANSPHPEPDSDAGSGSRSFRTVRRFSVGGGVHWRRPRSFTHRRARKVHDPLQRPSWSQEGSPSTQNARWLVSGGERLSRSSWT